MSEESVERMHDAIREALEEFHYARRIPQSARRVRRMKAASQRLFDLQDSARFAGLGYEFEDYLVEHADDFKDSGL